MNSFARRCWHVSKKGLPQTIQMKHDLHYVEELFHDNAGAVGRFIPIHRICPNPSQPRQNIGDLTDLVNSIKEKGVLEPLLVRTRENEYEIIAGERRWRAAREAGLDVVPCIEMEVTDVEMHEIALIENLQRKDLTPFEEAEGLQALAEKFGYTHAQIAKAVGKARSSVTEVLLLNQMPAEIKELCRRADISNKSLLLQVARQPDVVKMKSLADRISRGNVTRQQVREEQTKQKGKKKPYIYSSKGNGYIIRIYFNKHNATSEDVQAVLEELLSKLK